MVIEPICTLAELKNYEVRTKSKKGVQIMC